MEATIRQIPNQRNESLPYSRPFDFAMPKYLPRHEVADDEDANHTHEEGYGWQCVDVISDVPA